LSDDLAISSSLDLIQLEKPAVVYPRAPDSRLQPRIRVGEVARPERPGAALRGPLGIDRASALTKLVSVEKYAISAIGLFDQAVTVSYLAEVFIRKLLPRYAQKPGDRGYLG